jgi:hypothetical protein
MQLLTELPWLQITLAAALPAAGVARAWLSYRRAITLSRCRTARLALALALALQRLPQRHRARVIEACAKLESPNNT